MNINLFKLVAIISFNFNVNKFFSAKQLYFPKQENMRRVALYYIFANLLNFWLHRSLLDSHSRFCSHSEFTV